MSDEPRKRFDPVALAVLGTGAAVAVALAIYLGMKVSSAPPAQPTADQTALSDAASAVSKWIEAQRTRQAAPPAAKPSAPAPKAAPGALPVKTSHYPLEAGHVWRYRVTVEPPVWRDIVLTYRTVQQGTQVSVMTEMRHAGGNMNFNLGIYAPGHPTHANVRFPGFFFHPAYFDRPLAPGQRLTWEWPWQLPGGQVRAGRVKRYSGEVKEWRKLETAVGHYPAARIDATLSYIEDGRVQASAAETLWYMPQVQQVVKVTREGRTPDEATTRIVAELVEFR